MVLGERGWEEEGGRDVEGRRQSITTTIGSHANSRKCGRRGKEEGAHRAEGGGKGMREEKGSLRE